MRYESAPDIKKRITDLVEKLEMAHIKLDCVYCIRSLDAKTRATARVWGMAKLFKEVCGLRPHYIIEVNSKKFDKLGRREQTKTLIHELLHIPKTFSGALLSHRGRYHRIDDKTVEKILEEMD